MPNLMQRAAEWLGGKLQDVAGRSVVLLRNDQASAAIVGTVSKQLYTVLDARGIGVEVVSYDWMFTTSELPYTLRNNGGDGIRETLNGETIEYETMPLGDKPAVEWADTSGIITIVHSRRIYRA